MEDTGWGQRAARPGSPRPAPSPGPAATPGAGSGARLAGERGCGGRAAGVRCPVSGDCSRREVSGGAGGPGARGGGKGDP